MSCLTEDDEIIVSNLVENARKLADISEDEVEATARINQLDNAKIESLCPNRTGSFTFHLLITLPEGNRIKRISMTKRFGH